MTETAPSVLRCNAGWIKEVEAVSVCAGKDAVRPRGHRERHIAVEASAEPWIGDCGLSANRRDDAEAELAGQVGQLALALRRHFRGVDDELWNAGVGRLFPVLRRSHEVKRKNDRPRNVETLRLGELNFRRERAFVHHRRGGQNGEGGGDGATLEAQERRKLVLVTWLVGIVEIDVLLDDRVDRPHLGHLRENVLQVAGCGGGGGFTDAAPNESELEVFQRAWDALSENSPGRPGDELHRQGGYAPQEQNQLGRHSEAPRRMETGLGFRSCLVSGARLGAADACRLGAIRACFGSPWTATRDTESNARKRCA